MGPLGLNGFLHLVLFPKGEFLRTHHCWVPLVRMLSFPCFIVLKFFTPTFRGLYSPKESSLELTIVGPLGLSGSLHLGLFLKFSPPYEPWPLFSGWWGVGGGRITSENFYVSKIVFLSFFKQVQLIG